MALPDEATISFVIPVRNAAGHLARCLESIQRASAGLAGVEIVVVDNGSTDGSADVAARAGARVLLRPGLRVGAVRNAGVRATTGAIVAFVDADHEIAATWIAACRAALAQDGAGAVGRLCDPPTPATWVQRAYACLRDAAGDQRDVAWLGAGNLAVWRHVFDGAGGFDESVEACEDVDLCRAIRERGWRIVTEPKMRSIHHGDPATLAAVFRGERWRGRDNLRVSLRERLTVRSVSGLMQPVVTLALLAAAIAAAVSVPWWGPWPAAAAVAALGAVVALRTAVMVRRGRVRSVWRGLECAAVAAAYETARAVSLVLKGSHATRARGGA